MSAGHKYKLTYFNGRGRAEVSRLIFAAAGEPYEDFRIERSQWSGDLKEPSDMKETPFGQLPTLEIDGSVTICKSSAIALYLANEFGLAGKTPIDKALAHMIFECGEDTLKPLIEMMYEKDEAKKAEIKKKYIEEQLPQFVARFEKILVQNNGGDGFFVGDSLTYADLAIMHVCDCLKLVGGDVVFASNEKLHAHIERVRAVPKVAEWLTNRPQGQM